MRERRGVEGGNLRGDGGLGLRDKDRPDWRREREREIER